MIAMQTYHVENMHSYNLNRCLYFLEGGECELRGNGTSCKNDNPIKRVMDGGRLWKETKRIKVATQSTQAIHAADSNPDALQTPPEPLLVNARPCTVGAGRVASTVRGHDKRRKVLTKQQQRNIWR